MSLQFVLPPPPRDLKVSIDRRQYQVRALDLALSPDPLSRIVRERTYILVALRLPVHTYEIRVI